MVGSIPNILGFHFLDFFGNDLRSWLFKAEQFFQIDRVPVEERVMVASLHLEGEATEWHQAFMKYMSYTQPPTWAEYAMILTEKFRENYDDPMEELKKIVQTSNVRDYQTTFERSLTRVNLSQENAINCFIGGLKEQVYIAVKMTNPRSLAQAFKAAMMQEAYIDAQSKEIV